MAYSDDDVTSEGETKVRQSGVYLTKNKWTTEETELLKDIVSRLSCSNEDMDVNISLDWREVAFVFNEQQTLTSRPRRDHKQCRERYVCHCTEGKLKPADMPWSQEEEYVLCMAFCEVGTSWSELEKRFLPHRTHAVIKNNWNSRARNAGSSYGRASGPPQLMAIFAGLIKDNEHKWQRNVETHHRKHSPYDDESRAARRNLFQLAQKQFTQDLEAYGGPNAPRPLHEIIVDGDYYTRGPGKQHVKQLLRQVKGESGPAHDPPGSLGRQHNPGRSLVPLIPPSPSGTLVPMSPVVLADAEPAASHITPPSPLPMGSLGAAAGGDHLSTPTRDFSRAPPASMAGEWQEASDPTSQHPQEDDYQASPNASAQKRRRSNATSCTRRCLSQTTPERAHSHPMPVTSGSDISVPMPMPGFVPTPPAAGMYGGVPPGAFHTPMPVPYNTWAMYGPPSADPVMRQPFSPQAVARPHTSSAGRSPPHPSPPQPPTVTIKSPLSAQQQAANQSSLIPNGGTTGFEFRNHHQMGPQDLMDGDAWAKVVVSGGLGMFPASPTDGPAAIKGMEGGKQTGAPVAAATMAPSPRHAAPRLSEPASLLAATNQAEPLTSGRVGNDLNARVMDADGQQKDVLHNAGSLNPLVDQTALEMPMEEYMEVFPQDTSISGLDLLNSVPSAGHLPARLSTGLLDDQEIQAFMRRLSATGHVAPQMAVHLPAGHYSANSGDTSGHTRACGNTTRWAAPQRPNLPPLSSSAPVQSPQLPPQTLPQFPPHLAGPSGHDSAPATTFMSPPNPFATAAPQQLVMAGAPHGCMVPMFPPGATYLASSPGGGYAHMPGPGPNVPMWGGMWPMHPSQYMPHFHHGPGMALPPPYPRPSYNSSNAPSHQPMMYNMHQMPMQMHPAMMHMRRLSNGLRASLPTDWDPFYEGGPDGGHLGTARLSFGSGYDELLDVAMGGPPAGPHHHMPPQEDNTHTRGPTVTTAYQGVTKQSDGVMGGSKQVYTAQSDVDQGRLQRALGVRVQGGFGSDGGSTQGPGSFQH